MNLARFAIVSGGVHTNTEELWLISATVATKAETLQFAFCAFPFTFVRCISETEDVKREASWL